MQKYNQNELKFDDVYSRKKLPKTKDETYVVNLDEYQSIGNIYSMQANNSIICGHFWIGFIGFMLKGKSLKDYTF